ncbi:MAG TPA: hypothetical protein PKE31_20380, partial [Pseudomonadota bacterium]|nr:hypothetical protein [Pseudomonadota bacterium]
GLRAIVVGLRAIVVGLRAIVVGLRAIVVGLRAPAVVGGYVGDSRVFGHESWTGVVDPLETAPFDRMGNHGG